jgi:predicted TIM-barrel fold metal-dependent hydrolase
MQIAINFKNEEIAQKVLWMLEHFQKDGVEIIEIENTPQEILNNFQEGLHEVNLIKNKQLKSRSIEEFLCEL